MQPAPLNKKGVTLVEMMVALVVLLLVFLALMQTALVSIGYNMNNVLRDEAVAIAEMRMNNARTIPIGSLASDSALMVSIDPATGVATNITAATACPSTWTNGNVGVYVERNLKNVQNFGFCTFRTVSDLDTLSPHESKRVTIDVQWKWKGQDFRHIYSTVVVQR